MSDRVLILLVIAVVGGTFLGYEFGMEAQSFLYLQGSAWGCLVPRGVALSSTICALLGALTASGLVLQNGGMPRASSCLYLFASLVSVLSLNISRNSKLYHWWTIFTSPLHQKAFLHQYGTDDLYYGLTLSIAMNHSVPILWAAVLLYCGLKLLYQNRNQAYRTLARAT